MALCHTEYFEHILALSICGVHIMSSLGQAGEIFEVFGDVSWNGNVDIFLVIITPNGQSTVVIPFKVHGYFKYF